MIQFLVQIIYRIPSSPWIKRISAILQEKEKGKERNLIPLATISPWLFIGDAEDRIKAILDAIKENCLG